MSAQKFAASFVEAARHGSAITARRRRLHADPPELRVVMVSMRVAAAFERKQGYTENYPSAAPVRPV